MNKNTIKAPQHLKKSTLVLMKNQGAKRKVPKLVLVLVTLAAVCALSAFSFRLFSGLSGDEVALTATYKGEGVVEISVENQSSISLQFTDTVKLMQWSTSEEIATLQKEMPVIGPKETKTITLTLTPEVQARVSLPLSQVDHHYFLLTNNNFVHGQNWMASLTFAASQAPITEPTPEVSPNNTPPPIEDHSDTMSVETIRKGYSLEAPLKDMKITQAYSDAKVEGVPIHPFLDLSAKKGEKVYSIGGGTVLTAAFDVDKGNFLVLDHGNGLQSTYAHCAILFKEKGDTIVKGEAIATVGSTGMATGANLEFGITLDGVAINPEHLFSCQ